MFNLFFNKKKVITETKNTIYASIQKQEEERRAENKKIQEIVMKEQLGKLVVCVSNEIQNPTVGYGKEIIFITKAQIPQLVVHDIVNDCEIIPMGKVFTYTEQKFHALNSLEANERIAIIYNQYEEHAIDKTPSMGEEILFDNEVWAEKVRNAIKIWNNKKEG